MCCFLKRLAILDMERSRLSKGNVYDCCRGQLNLSMTFTFMCNGVQMIISQYANEFKSYSLFQCRNLAFLARLRVRGDRSHQNFGAIKLVAVRKTPSNVQTVATLKCQTGNPWYADNL